MILRTYSPTILLVSSRNGEGQDLFGVLELIFFDFYNIIGEREQAMIFLLCII